jgi:hypothetical protein
MVPLISVILILHSWGEGWPDTNAKKLIMVDIWQVPEPSLMSLMVAGKVEFSASLKCPGDIYDNHA